MHKHVIVAHELYTNSCDTRLYHFITGCCMMRLSQKCNSRSKLVGRLKNNGVFACFSKCLTNKAVAQNVNNLRIESRFNDCQLVVQCRTETKSH